MATQPISQVSLTDDNKSLVLLTQQILHWHLNVVELNESRPSSSRVGRLNKTCLHAILPRDQEH